MEIISDINKMLDIKCIYLKLESERSHFKSNEYKSMSAEKDDDLTPESISTQNTI
jgi:hypothetical protein